MYAVVVENKMIEQSNSISYICELAYKLIQAKTSQFVSILLLDEAIEVKFPTNLNITGYEIIASVCNAC